MRRASSSRRARACAPSPRRGRAASPPLAGEAVAQQQQDLALARREQAHPAIFVGVREQRLDARVEPSAPAATVWIASSSSSGSPLFSATRPLASSPSSSCARLRSRCRPRFASPDARPQPACRSARSTWQGEVDQGDVGAPAQDQRLGGFRVVGRSHDVVTVAAEQQPHPTAKRHVVIDYDDVPGLASGVMPDAPLANRASSFTLRSRCSRAKASMKPARRSGWSSPRRLRVLISSNARPGSSLASPSPCAGGRSVVRRPRDEAGRSHLVSLSAASIVYPGSRPASTRRRSRRTGPGQHGQHIGVVASGSMGLFVSQPRRSAAAVAHAVAGPERERDRPGSARARARCERSGAASSNASHEASTSAPTARPSDRMYLAETAPVSLPTSVDL